MAVHPASMAPVDADRHVTLKGSAQTVITTHAMRNTDSMKHVFGVQGGRGAELAKMMDSKRADWEKYGPVSHSFSHFSLSFLLPFLPTFLSYLSHFSGARCTTTPPRRLSRSGRPCSTQSTRYGTTGTHCRSAHWRTSRFLCRSAWASGIILRRLSATTPGSHFVTFFSEFLLRKCGIHN